MFRPVLTVRTNHNKTTPAHVLCFAHNTQAGVLLFFRYDPQFFKYSLGLCSADGVTSCAQGSAGTAHTLPASPPADASRSLPAVPVASRKGFGNAAGDAGKGVAVAAQRDRIAKCILKTDAFQKSNDCFRHSFLTGLHMMIGRPNFIAGTVQVITEGLLHILFDFRLAVAGTGQKIAAAVACAPLMPSGWLWVTSAVTFAISSVLSSVSNSQPAADTRIAEPLPKLP